jgi:hypothetical protein
MKRNLENKSRESQERWEFIEKKSREVDQWPDWKKSEVSPDSDGEIEKKDLSSADNAYLNGLIL